MKVFGLIVGAALALASGPGFAQEVPQGAPNVPEFSPAFPEQTRAPQMRSGVAIAVESFAEGLENPWGIVALPGGGYLVTERPGRLRYVAADGTVGAPIKGLPDSLDAGQGGLLDVTIGPDFAKSRVIYFTYAKPIRRGRSATAAARAVIDPGFTALTDLRDIFVQDPPSRAPMHFGARIVIDGGIAFITVGEHSNRSDRVKAQQITQSYGKVIRIRTDGTVPKDNPFADGEGHAPLVWTLGHRNPQGAAFDGRGRLWTLEHGPAGGDELNLITPGANYGWPVVSYGENYNGRPVGSGASSAPGFAEPVYYWDPVIAPSGFAFYTGDLFPWKGDILIGSLNPGGLVRLRLRGDKVVGEERFLEGEARLRDIEIAADGSILALVDAPNGGIWRLRPAP